MENEATYTQSIKHAPLEGGPSSLSLKLSYPDTERKKASSAKHPTYIHTAPPTAAQERR